MEYTTLTKKLLELDVLYEAKESFSHWLSGETSNETSYQQLLTEIETATGMRVLHVDITYRYAHVLAPRE